MPLEIERKFLVTGEGWRTTSGRLIRQGYLSLDPERTVRIRSAGDSAWITIKGLSNGPTRAEFEYPVPTHDLQPLLDLCHRPLVEKTRHRVEHEGHTWEIDEFHGDNAGLVVAEIELEQEDATIPLPGWLGREVTTDRRYFNSNLSINPYRNWKDEAATTP